MRLRPPLFGRRRITALKHRSFLPMAEATQGTFRAKGGYRSSWRITPITERLPPNYNGGSYVSMDACGCDRDTDLRIIFSSAGRPKRSRDRGSRRRGWWSGHRRSSRGRCWRSWRRGYRQLDEQPSPLPSLVLQSSPLQSLLNSRLARTAPNLAPVIP